MYQALYRKYRPQKIEDVVGQEVIVKILSNSIKNNKISHAYLFSGPRGTGKTSVAKLMAKIVNCNNLNGLDPCDNCESCLQFNLKNNTDIIEIDAASNNGVDEIRELKNKINLVPTLGKYKVYIIDEVHMLTIGAFNALLKTLEEPPSHAIFILATTEVHKIPITILSRCQRLDFKKITNEALYERLKNICDKENIKYEDEALKQIANLCDGGMRDSISMLDKLAAYTNDNITFDDVNEINGLITTKQINDLLECIKNKKYKEIFEIIDDFNKNGKNFIKILEEIIIYLRNELLNIINNEKNSILDKNEIIEYIDEFNNIINLVKQSSTPKIILETNIIKMMSEKTNVEQNIVHNNIQNNTKKSVYVKTYEEKKEKVETLPDNVINDISELKKIRVHNTLSKFNKKKMLEINQKIEEINSFLIDPDYSNVAGLIIDGKLKATSDSNLIFVYESDNVALNFNLKIPAIETLLNKINIDLKVIAVEQEEWDKIKVEFNSKTKKYIYQDDTNIVNKIFKNKENNEKNSIESMFNDIIKYD